MAMERILQEILERLSAGQQEMRELTALQEEAAARREKAAARQEKAAAHQEKATAELKAAYAEMEARAEARHERFLAFIEGSKSYRKRTRTCQTEKTSCAEEMDATRLVNPGAAEGALEWQELREKEINVDNIGLSEDRCEEQRLVVRRRRGARKQTQDNVGSRQKSSAARKRDIRRAVLAVCKRHMRKGPGKNNVARGASRGKMLDKRQRNNSECEDGRLGRDLKRLEFNYREDWITDEQREQLENRHHEDWTTDTSRRNGLLYSVRPFGTNNLKEGAM
jgi:hypothetical protein